MHKNRLQELCQKRMWALPAYTSSRDGPDHDPRFRASVVVNGHTFEAPILSKSVREAHNNAAEVALDHLSSIASASSTPTHPAGDTPPAATGIQTSYKTQLQHYVQKRNIGVLKYDSVRKGSAHALRFKARVTVDGQTFESSEYFSTLREAEHSAARVALMSLPLEENLQDGPNLYKNLLQQFVQKEGLSLPLYNTLFDGASHMPIFTCTVVVEGESFVGDVAKTKRQAEMNAAKVAWYHVKERINGHSNKVTRGKIIDNLEQPKIHPAPPSFIKTEDRNQSVKGNDAFLTKISQSAAGLSLKCQVKHDDSPISLRNQLAAIDVMDQPNLNSIPTSTLKIKEDDHQAKGVTSVSEQQNGLSVPTSNVKIKEEKQANGKVEDNERVVNTTSVVMNEPDDIFSYDDYTDLLDLSNVKLDYSWSAVKNDSAIKNKSAVVNDSHNSPNVNKPRDEIFSNGHVDQLDYSLLKLDFDESKEDGSSEDTDTDTDIIKDINADDHKIVDSPLLCNRVRVYPSKSDIILPVGATLLPFSDDAWVAVSLDFSEHEDNLPTIS